MRLHPNWRLLFVIFAVVVGLPVAAVVIMAKVPPVATPLMLLRTWGYQASAKMPAPHGWSYRWVPLTRIAPALARAVVAAEDTTFCGNNGFDPEAYNRAWENYRDGIIARGGSTITQQTAKNVFLWPGRSILRKGLETVLTPLLETIWGKRRIMEVYLNVVEWAPGIYGVEAAARYHFHHGADQLTPREAALLAAVLPSPRHWSASAPGPYVLGRVGVIMAREPEVAIGCVKQ